jgi:hypothetical protein
MQSSWDDGSCNDYQQKAAARPPQESGEVPVYEWPRSEPGNERTSVFFSVSRWNNDRKMRIDGKVIEVAQ